MPTPAFTCRAVSALSAAAGPAGRRFFREWRRPLLWALTFSPEWPAKLPVGAVALPPGRGVPLSPGTKPPSPPSGPNPLGENQSLSSPPLEPRGLLLSVMRQKVGKERNQGDYRPLGYPPPFFGLPSQKVRPVAHPLEALQNPGWGAQRHRRGRRCKTSQRARNKLFSPRLSRDLTMTVAATPLRTGLLLENRDRRSRESPPPHAARATFTSFFRSAAGGNSSFKKQSWSARLGDSFYFAECEIVESLLSVARGISRCILRRKPSKSPCGAARHSKAGVGSATSYDCPTRAASG